MAALINESLRAPPDAALANLLSAATMDPKNGLVQNNLCVAYIQLHRHDDAIAACNAALLSKSDFQLARNNLAWARAEQAKAQAAATAAP